MPQPRRGLPLAPLVLSAALVVLGVLYVGTGGQPPHGNTDGLRVLSWDVSSSRTDDSVVSAIASVLADLDLNAFALQGLASQADSAAIADLLGSQWRYETVRGPDGRYLAVFAGPEIDVKSWHLVPTDCGDALGVIAEHETGRTISLVSLRLTPDQGDGGLQTRCAASLLDWCRRNTAEAIILAGPMRLGPDASDQLGKGFVHADSTQTCLRLAVRGLRVVSIERVSQSSVRGVADPELAVIALPSRGANSASANSTRRR